MEWLPIATAAIAGLLIFPYSTPEILPADAPKHDGNTATVEGMVIQQRGAWFTIAAAGSAIEAHHETPPEVGAQVAATGNLDENTLFVKSWKTKTGSPSDTTLHAVKANPSRFLHTLISLQGTGTGFFLEADGAKLPTSKPLEGAVRVTGALTYQPDCLCHHLVIHSSTSL